MMARRRSQILIAMVVITLMAVAAYVRLWTIDYQISFREADLIRRQFDLANKEAMDESAEWRQRFDSEVEKSARCMKELDEMRKSHKMKDFTGVKKLEMLEKENMDLLERIEMLKQELETEKFNCSTRQQ